METLNKLLDLINDLAPLIYALTTAGIGFFIRARDIAIKKKKEIDAENDAKNKSNYNLWEHEESQRVIRKIKELCNFFRDKGHMDSVSFIQLENGTVATSKLCNMFVSCLAEDSRFSNIPKYISKFQRVPYSKVSYWADSIQDMKTDNNSETCVLTPDSLVLGEYASIRSLMNLQCINSSVVSPVYDPNGVLLGAGVFLYSKKNFNGLNEEEQIKLMTEFRISLETIFLDYFISRREKKKEFNILGGDY